MDSSHFKVGDISTTYTLHYEFKKFWSITANSSTFETVVKCGKYDINGNEDESDIQIHNKSHSTSDEAKEYMEKHIKVKLSKGYELASQKASLALSPSIKIKVPDLKSPSKASNGVESGVVNSNDSHKRKLNGENNPDPEKRIKLNEDRPQLEKNKSIEEFESALKAIQEQEKFQNNQDTLGDFTQKQVTLKIHPRPFLPQLDKKAMELEVFFDIDKNTLFVTGYQKKIDEFETYAKNLVDTSSDAELARIPSEKKSEEFIQKEVPYNQYHKACRDDLKSKVEELELVIELGDGKMLVAGYESKVNVYIEFMQKKEKEMKEKDGKIIEESKSNPGSSKPSAIKLPPPVVSESLKKINLTKYFRGKGLIEQSAILMKLDIEFYEKEFNVRGDKSKFAEFSKIFWEAQAENKKTIPTYDQREMKISNHLKFCKGDLETKAVELELMLDFVNDNAIQFGGNQSEMTNFLLWLYEKEAESKKYFDSRADEGELEQKEINISTFHRSKRKEIEKKAEEMGLMIDFGYDLILASGTNGAISAFIKLLTDIESESKRALYPKYWDFYEVNSFSMTFIKNDSEEFKEAEKLFIATMPVAKIKSLHRIQNRFLMDHYVTMIQKRQELHPNEKVNRMLLFHGTRATEPERIYKNFDTGFDLQYAAHGAYGKGIYFARDSSYSHGFAHPLKKNGHFQMLIADVFVGKAYDHSKSGGMANYVKAPDGYDSVSAGGAFYMLYNNLHSYPLYLIEYKHGGGGARVMPGVGGGLFGARPLFGAGAGVINYAGAGRVHGGFYNNAYGGDDDDDEDDSDYDG